MLLRRGSAPGTSWMKRLDEGLNRLFDSPAEDKKRWHRRWWGWYLPFFLLLVFSTVFSRALIDSEGKVIEYESPIKISGLPLVASGEFPRAVVALGSYPVGVIAIGGVSVGVIALGGLAAGGIALGGVSAGVFAVGGLALGWWASGGGAVGYYAFGGLAVGGYAYAGGGVAYGYHEASGRQKEALFG